MGKAKIVLFSVVVLILALLVVACGGDDPASAGKEKEAEKTDGTAVASIDYADPIALSDGSQADFESFTYQPGDKVKVVYMPPATEFNYYMAIGEGIKTLGAELGIDYSMLAPQSGADIDGQMGMLQDVISQKPDAIIFSTHDEHAAAPLVEQAVSQGIMVIIVNSDIAEFPTPIHAVVGYNQRNGTRKMGEYAAQLIGDKDVSVGLIEGQPGYHSTERIGGFTDIIDDMSNFVVESSLDGKWNVEGGNVAAMDMLQASPNISLVFAANDYMIMGAARAANALNKADIILLGNDGDTACLEEIAAGTVHATVNTTPFIMGKIVLQVLMDGLSGTFKGGYVETPTVIVDESNVLEYLRQPEALYPKPSKAY